MSEKISGHRQNPAEQTSNQGSPFAPDKRYDTAKGFWINPSPDNPALHPHKTVEESEEIKRARLLSDIENFEGAYSLAAIGKFRTMNELRQRYNLPPTTLEEVAENFKKRIERDKKRREEKNSENSSA